ncbi:hypothetical protein ACFPZ0_01495 [Streptomonospora nanhaiensis]|nr:hypothetical protein [Streptomonospora nanhaiensis]MBX9390017.1 hypothetical protein [Streptomonospora nanhaiensis]
MSDDEGSHLISSVERGESGPWTCPECGEYAVESGQRFEQGRVVGHALMCFACQAEVVAPA